MISNIVSTFYSDCWGDSEFCGLCICTGYSGDTFGSSKYYFQVSVSTMPISFPLHLRKTTQFPENNNRVYAAQCQHILFWKRSYICSVYLVASSVLLDLQQLFYMLLMSKILNQSSKYGTLLPNQVQIEPYIFVLTKKADYSYTQICSIS